MIEGRDKSSRRRRAWLGAASVVLVTLSLGRAGGQGPSPRPDGPWRKTLPGVGTVELIGLAAEPAGPGDWWDVDGSLKVEGRWWAPDGSPLAKPPAGASHQSGEPGPGFATNRVAVRAPAGLDDVYSYWAFAPGGRGGGGNTYGTAEDGLGSVHRFTIVRPADLAAGTVRFGIAHGPWKAEAAAEGGAGGASTRIVGAEEVTTVFARAQDRKATA